MLSKNILTLLFIVLFSSFNCSVNERNLTSVEKAQIIKRVGFCDLFNNITEYESMPVKTTGIFIGFHEFILYSKDCLKEDHVFYLEFNKDSRKQLYEKVNLLSEKVLYKNNMYGEITITGIIEKNLNNSKSDELKETLPYKILITEVNDLTPLQEKVIPGNENNP